MDRSVIRHIVKFNAPLNRRDTEFQTYGCRRPNPEICKNNCLIDVCAFVREDGVCKSPSNAWAKRYRLLASTSEQGEHAL